MRTQVSLYLRIGKGRNGIKVAASTRRAAGALKETINYNTKEIPTVQYKLKLDIPDGGFDPAEVLIPIDSADLEAMAPEVVK